MASIIAFCRKFTKSGQFQEKSVNIVCMRNMHIYSYAKIAILVHVLVLILLKFGPYRALILSSQVPISFQRCALGFGSVNHIFRMKFYYSC